jgi:phenylacetate-CoA ligase
MSPGIDMDSTMNVVENISPNFDQTIIYSYPPFAKDILDNLPKKLIKKCNFKLVVYGEPYTEKWRSYTLNKIGSNITKPHDVSSVLGSSEGGLIGTETISCTTLRILASRNKKLCKALFKETRVPSVIQFNPMAKYIEIVGTNIVLTSMGGLPLIRYDTRDYGSALSKEEIISILKGYQNTDFNKETAKYKSVVTGMPYLYVFGRSDYTASIYGVLIYPETVKDILATSPFCKFLSGKFVMSTNEDENSNQFLNIICETKKAFSRSEVAIPYIEKTFAGFLKKYSGEYKKLLSAMGRKVYPKIVIHNYGDSEHFLSNNKHKYLI